MSSPEASMQTSQTSLQRAANKNAFFQNPLQNPSSENVICIPTWFPGKSKKLFSSQRKQDYWHSTVQSQPKKQRSLS
jgi:hypothetical protein